MPPKDFRQEYYDAYRAANGTAPPNIVDWGSGWYFMTSPGYRSKKMRASQIEAMTERLKTRVARKENA